mmetsp:Transcript_39083/g.96196  ORF Transcript_39083/g.96196 Transcript_39083/m.96196 type:complete len:313 (-) Transcript_39083:277-1215(-)
MFCSCSCCSCRRIQSSSASDSWGTGAAGCAAAASSAFFLRFFSGGSSSTNTDGSGSTWGTGANTRPSTCGHHAGVCSSARVALGAAGCCDAAGCPPHNRARAVPSAFLIWYEASSMHELGRRRSSHSRRAAVWGWLAGSRRSQSILSCTRTPCTLKSSSIGARISVCPSTLLAGGGILAYFGTCCRMQSAMGSKKSYLRPDALQNISAKASGSTKSSSIFQSIVSITVFPPTVALSTTGACAPAAPPAYCGLGCSILAASNSSCHPAGLAIFSYLTDGFLGAGGRPSAILFFSSSASFLLRLSSTRLAASRT